jgi:hypothetical protein
MNRNNLLGLSAVQSAEVNGRRMSGIIRRWLGGCPAGQRGIPQPSVGARSARLQGWPLALQGSAVCRCRTLNCRQRDCRLFPADRSIVDFFWYIPSRTYRQPVAEETEDRRQHTEKTATNHQNFRLSRYPHGDSMKVISGVKVLPLPGGVSPFNPHGRLTRTFSPSIRTG